MKALDACGCVPALFGTVDLWTTAVESRVVWAQEMMRDASEALLAVQTLRNVVVAATLIVMAMAQVRRGRVLRFLRAAQWPSADRTDGRHACRPSSAAGSGPPDRRSCPIG